MAYMKENYNTDAIKHIDNDMNVITELLLN